MLAKKVVDETVITQGNIRNILTLIKSDQRKLSSSAVLASVRSSRYFTIIGVYTLNPCSCAKEDSTFLLPATTTAFSGMTIDPFRFFRIIVLFTRSYTGAEMVRRNTVQLWLWSLTKTLAHIDAWTGKCRCNAAKRKCWWHTCSFYWWLSDCSKKYFFKCEYSGWFLYQFCR